MYTNPRKVAILLSTYNGEKFLREQLDSLMNQTSRDFHLYIRDDGSTDQTLSIVQEFAQRYSDMVTVVSDETKHRHAAGSFFYLLQNVNSLYYMFCDQDDVWLADKVAVSVQSIEEVEMRDARENGSRYMPIVAFTDLKVVDENLQEIAASFNALNHLERYERNSDILMVHNVATGCAMIFNQAAKDISFPVSPYAHMHDEWISMCTHFKGGLIVPIKRACILYRQHSRNTIGARQLPVSQKVKSLLWQKQLVKKMKLAHCAFGVSYFKFFKMKYFYSRG